MSSTFELRNILTLPLQTLQAPQNPAQREKCLAPRASSRTRCPPQKIPTGSGSRLQTPPKWDLGLDPRACEWDEFSNSCCQARMQEKRIRRHLRAMQAHKYICLSAGVWHVKAGGPRINKEAGGKKRQFLLMSEVFSSEQVEPVESAAACLPNTEEERRCVYNCAHCVKRGSSLVGKRLRGGFLACLSNASDTLDIHTYMCFCLHINIHLLITCVCIASAHVIRVCAVQTIQTILLCVSVRWFSDMLMQTTSVFIMCKIQVLSCSVKRSIVTWVFHMFQLQPI